jgi:hypothetical protein
MEKPILLVTRKLPEVIEARAARDYDARLNPGQMHFAAVAIDKRLANLTRAVLSSAEHTNRRSRQQAA